MEEMTTVGATEEMIIVEVEIEGMIIVDLSSNSSNQEVHDLSKVVQVVRKTDRLNKGSKEISRGDKVHHKTVLNNADRHDQMMEDKRIVRRNKVNDRRRDRDLKVHDLRRTDHRRDQDLMVGRRRRINN